MAVARIQPGFDPTGARDAVEMLTLTTTESTVAAVVHTLTSLQPSLDAWLEGVKEVVIEEQVLKNVHMKRIQHYLEAIFVLRGCEVKCPNARGKLVWAGKSPWWPAAPAMAEKKMDYLQRKRVSVQTTGRWLDATVANHAPSALLVWHQATKKDDLGDALIQGLAWQWGGRSGELLRLQAKVVPRPKTVACVPRKPKGKAMAASNIKWLCLYEYKDDLDAFERRIKIDKTFRKAVLKLFGDTNTCWQCARREGRFAVQARGVTSASKEEEVQGQDANHSDAQNPAN